MKKYQAIIIGGLVIAAVYLLGGFGIGAGIPADEIDAAAGLIESVVLMSGQEGGIFNVFTTALGCKHLKNSFPVRLMRNAMCGWQKNMA